MASSKNNSATNSGEEQKPSKEKTQRDSSFSTKKSTSASKPSETEGLSTESSNSEIAAELLENTKSSDIKGMVDAVILDENLHQEEKKVKFIIRKRKDGAFLVYLDHDLQVRWDRTTDVFENERYNADPKYVERILARAQTTGAIPTPFLTKEQRETKSRIIGEAVALALCGDIRAANQTLKDARNFIKAKAIEKARIWTVEGSLGAFLTLTVLFTIIAFLVPNGNDFNKIEECIRDLSIAAVFGLIGSQFSVLQRFDQLEVAPLSGRLPHMVEAFSRILMGALAGIIMYVLLRAQIFFGFIDHLKDSSVGPEQWVTWTLVIVAGASERLIPSFMTTIETQAAGDLIESDDKPVSEKSTPEKSG